MTILLEASNVIKSETIATFIRLVLFFAIALSISAYEQMSVSHPLVLLYITTCSYFILVILFLIFYQLKNGALYLHVGDILVFYLIKHPDYLRIGVLAWTGCLSMTYFIITKTYSILNNWWVRKILC